MSLARFATSCTHNPLRPLKRYIKWQSWLAADGLALASLAPALNSRFPAASRNSKRNLSCLRYCHLSYRWPIDWRSVNAITRLNLKNAICFSFRINFIPRMSHFKTRCAQTPFNWQQFDRHTPIKLTPRHGAFHVPSYLTPQVGITFVIQFATPICCK